jgi:hypothetical protein
MSGDQIIRWADRDANSGLDGPGIESQWGRDFTHQSRSSMGQLPIKWVPGVSRGAKRPGHGVYHPPPTSAEIKERVELYLLSPLVLRSLFQVDLYFIFIYIYIHTGCFKKSFTTITIRGKPRCVLLHFDSSKRCVCPLKFIHINLYIYIYI